MGFGTSFFTKGSPGRRSRVINGTWWVGLAFCVAAGNVIDKWIELKLAAIANNATFHLDWLQWAKGLFFVGAAVFTTLRTFTDNEGKGPPEPPA